MSNMKYALFLEGICLLREAGEFLMGKHTYTLKSYQDLNSCYEFILLPKVAGTGYAISLAEEACPLMRVVGPRLVFEARIKSSGFPGPKVQTFYADLPLRPLAVEWINDYGYLIPP